MVPHSNAGLRTRGLHNSQQTTATAVRSRWGTSLSATSRAFGKIFSRDGHLFGRQKRDKSNSFCSQPLDFMAVPAGLEPATFGLGNRSSMQLNYGDRLEFDPER